MTCITVRDPTAAYGQFYAKAPASYLDFIDDLNELGLEDRAQHELKTWKFDPQDLSLRSVDEFEHLYFPNMRPISPGVWSFRGTNSKGNTLMGSYNSLYGLVRYLLPLDQSLNEEWRVKHGGSWPIALEWIYACRAAG